MTDQEYMRLRGWYLADEKNALWGKASYAGISMFAIPVHVMAFETALVIQHREDATLFEYARKPGKRRA